MTGKNRTAHNATSISTFFIAGSSLEIEIARLVRLAEHSYATRQMDRVNEITNALLEAPSGPIQGVGYYFLGLSLRCLGADRFAESTQVLERAASMMRSPARPIVAIAANIGDLGDTQNAAALYLKTANSSDLWSSLASRKMLAVLKAAHGDHRRALHDLESLLPLARLAARSRPDALYDLLNSLAVESMETGDYARALDLSSRVIRSPYATAIPEFTETYNAATARTRRPSVLTCNLQPAAFNQSAAVSAPKHAALKTAKTPKRIYPHRSHLVAQKANQLRSLLVINEHSLTLGLADRLMNALDASPLKRVWGTLEATESALTVEQIDSAIKLLTDH